MAQVPEASATVVFSPYRVCPLGAHIDHQVHAAVESSGIGTAWGWLRALGLCYPVRRGPPKLPFLPRTSPCLSPLCNLKPALIHCWMLECRPCRVVQ